VDVSVFLCGQEVAELRFVRATSAWELARKTLLVAPTEQTERAIKIATSSLMMDVFQPTGRVVQLNEVQYVAKPIPTKSI
jgi:hypothetical protein